LILSKFTYYFFLGKIQLKEWGFFLRFIYLTNDF